MIEGVMMRSPRFFAVACRRPDKEIVVQQESVESYLGKLKWLNKPFLRGTLALIDSMAMGMKALSFSADIAMQEPPKEGDAPVTLPSDRGTPAPKKSGSINDIAIASTMVIGLLLGIVIFVVLPQFLAGRLLTKVIHNSIALNVIEGFVRIGVFMVYLWAISRMKDIQRIFQYHGAEHKVINAFEAGLDLNKENIDKYTTIHPRCGTSFITIFLILSIVVFSFLGWHHSILMRIVSRLVLFPVIAGIAYEAIRFAGKYRHTKLVGALFAPGMWLQRITTSEPTDDQVEVALAALNAVRAKEEEAGAVA